VWTINWWPWRKKPVRASGEAAALEREAAAAAEREADHHRRLSLERTYQTVQAHERDIRAAAERVQAELDVLRREH
jgi:hypothetical protein